MGLDWVPQVRGRVGLNLGWLFFNVGGARVSHQPTQVATLVIGGHNIHFKRFLSPHACMENYVRECIIYVQVWESTKNSMA